MKILFLLFFIIFYNSAVLAQLWFDFGLNTGLGTGFYIGNEFYNKECNLIPKIGRSESFKIGINPSEVHSIVIEFGHAVRNYQLEQYNIPNQDPAKAFTTSLHFSAFETALLYRKTTEGSFLEIGPMFSSTLYQTTIDDITVQEINNNVVNNSIFRGVFGIGGYIIGNERVTLVSGIRLLYDFTDIRSKLITNTHYPFHFYSSSSTKGLHALDLQLNFELNISMGYLVRSSCGKRSVVFQF